MTAVVITNKRIKVDVIKHVDRITESNDKIFITVFKDTYPMSHVYKKDDIDEIKVY